MSKTLATHIYIVLVILKKNIFVDRLHSRKYQYDFERSRYYGETHKASKRWIHINENG
jgi:hypothetical protein